MAVVRAADIMAASVTILTAGGGVTDAGANVWAPRDWPSTPPAYPCIYVSVPHELKESRVGRGPPPEFTAVMTLRMGLRLSEGATINDGSAPTGQHELDALQAQIEQNIINHPAIWALEVQEFLSIEQSTQFDATTAMQLSHRVLDIKIEYVCEPESFYQPPTHSFVEFTAIVQEPADTVEPGIDVTLPGG